MVQQSTKEDSTPTDSGRSDALNVASDTILNSIDNVATQTDLQSINIGVGRSQIGTRIPSLRGVNGRT